MDEAGIAYRMTAHAPLLTVADARAVRGRLESAAGHIKNLFLRNRKGKLWLLTVHEERRVDLKAAAAQLQAGRLSFASPETLLRHLGVLPGAVTPLALLNDVNRAVTFYMGEELGNTELIHPHPLVSTATVTMRRTELLRLLAQHGHPCHILPGPPAAD